MNMTTESQRFDMFTAAHDGFIVGVVGDEQLDMNENATSCKRRRYFDENAEMEAQNILAPSSSRRIATQPRLLDHTGIRVRKHGNASTSSRRSDSIDAERSMSLSDLRDALMEN